MEFSTVTLFKNVTPSFFTFRNFYEKVWNVNEFIYIVGYNTIDDYNFIVTKYISSVSDVYETKKIDKFNYSYFNSVEIFESIYNGIHNVFILYKTSNNKDPFNDFNKIKKICFTIIKTKYVSVNRKYISVDDDEAMSAGIELSRLEGIIPAIETAHAFSVFDKLDIKGKVVVVNLSGRGDKDLDTYIKWGKY